MPKFRNCRPPESYIEIDFNIRTPSVRRKVPSHFLQNGVGTILSHPHLDNSLKLPDVAYKPKKVGEIHFTLAQLLSAYKESGFKTTDLFVNEFSALSHLFEDDEYGLCFREDLPIEPCNFLLFLRKFRINNDSYHEPSLIIDCFEEIIRMFCYLDIIVVPYKEVGIDIDVLTKLQFIKVSGTDLAIRDNDAVFHDRFVTSPSIKDFFLMGN